MRAGKRLVAAVLAAILMCSAVAVSYAEESISQEESWQELSRLLKLARYEEAWVEAESLAWEWEGESQFDLLMGLSAYHTQRYYEAVFALERVVHAEPENMYARFVLAKSYYELGDMDSAQKEFKIVKANNPPVDVARELNTYLTRLGVEGDRKSTLLGYIEGYIGHDDNINRATADKTVSFPSLPPGSIVEINDLARKKSDMYTTLGGGLSYYQPLKSGLGLTVKGSLTHKDNFSSDEFDEGIIKLRADMNKTHNRDTWRLGLAGQNYRLDSSSYSNIAGLYGDWLRNGLGGWDYTLGLSYNDISYPDQELFDVQQYYLNGSVRRRWGRTYHTLGLMFGDEKARNDAGKHNARDSTILFYDYSIYLDPRNSLQARLIYNDSERDEADPVFQVVREDEFLGAMMIWNLQYNPQLLINTRLGYSDNDSEISLYSYDRSYLETGVKYTF